MEYEDPDMNEFIPMLVAFIILVLSSAPGAGHLSYRTGWDAGRSSAQTGAAGRSGNSRHGTKT